jgi:cytochrome P450
MISLTRNRVNSDAIPESDKTIDRITQEARTLVGAGTETTGNTLETIVYHVLSNSAILHRLKQELSGAFATIENSSTPIPSYSMLQSLPYLTAIIHEGLRISCSVSGRLARVDPRHTHTYKDYVLHSGTVISMNIRSNHTSEAIYPDSLRFAPERWLVRGEELKRLEKYFVPFGKGSRSCIGRELAMLNLYLTTAAFLHEFDAELFETQRKDIEMEHDYFSPFPAADSKGLRVILR